MNKYPKSIRRKLRELAGIAYQRELDTELKSLKEKFNDWENGKIDCFELSEHIHKFHNGLSLEIWKKYNNLTPDMTVPDAVALGILERNEIPEEILNIIDSRVKFFQEINKDE